jgi:hypothetical protein
MKKYISIQSVITLCLLVSAALTFSACDKNDGPTASEKQMKLLVGTWNMAVVTVDGVDYTSVFDGLSLTFTDAPPRYSAVNGGKVWVEPKDFIFQNFDATEFIGPNFEIVTITTLTDRLLVLELRWNQASFEAGRAKSIAGHHVFMFNKQL